MLLAGLLASDAWALALGRASLQSALGEPLRAEIDLPSLSAAEAATLEFGIASPEAFQNAGIEYHPLLTDVRLMLERGANGHARLHLSGSRAANVPYLLLLLQVNWAGGQLTRGYALLLDPNARIPNLPQMALAWSASPPRAAPPVPLASPRPLKAPAASVEATAPARPPKPAPEPAPAAVPVPPTEPPAATASASEPVHEVAPAPASPPAPAPKPAPATTLETEAGSGWSAWFTQVPWLLAGASAVALLIWVRRRQAARTEGQAALTRMAEEARFAGEGESGAPREQVAPMASVMHMPSQLEAAGGVDPIAEADVYLAYGRDRQAEEILRDALRSQPERVSLHLKLLDIHAQRKDRAGYAATATQVQALTHGSGPDWATAREQGYRLDPGNPLYQTPAGQSSQARGPATVTPRAIPSLAVPPPPREAGDTLPGPLSELDFDLSQPALRPGSPDRNGPTATGIKAPQDFEPTRPPEASDSSVWAEIEIAENASRADPLETTLSLAGKCLALGDPEGARRLAAQVSNQATGELQARARALLARLA